RRTGMSSSDRVGTRLEWTPLNRVAEKNKNAPTTTCSGVFAEEMWWSGAGSNRRPSAFQAERSPCWHTGDRGQRVVDGCRSASMCGDVAVSTAVTSAGRRPAHYESEQ